MQEKCDLQARSIASLEERCISLKSTIDQLTLSLERAAGTESEMKAELQNLQRTLMDTTTATHTGAERLKHVKFSAECILLIYLIIDWHFSFKNN